MGLKELLESEKYKSYLSTMSKFHNYSFNNTLLIPGILGAASTVDIFWFCAASYKNTRQHIRKSGKISGEDFQLRLVQTLRKLTCKCG
jgi:hypothetical protein